MVCSELVKSEDWNSEYMGHRSHQQCDWSTLENDRRYVDSGQTRGPSGSDTNPFAIRGEHESTKQDIDEFGATIGCPGCNTIKDNKRHKPTQIVAEGESKNASESLHTEQKDWIEVK